MSLIGRLVEKLLTRGSITLLLPGKPPHTFGPGDYGTLPPELQNRVSSARRISNRYPYREEPNWRGRQ